MTNDRITDLYEGRVGTAIEQRLAAARIHWTISQVKGPDVLDIGCGQGIATLLLAREGRRAVGIDRNPETIGWARRRAGGEQEAVHGRLTYDVAEAGNLPFPDASFDSVLIGAVLEEQVDPRLIIREALRVLRADGRLVATSLYAELRAPPFGEPLYLQGLIGLLAGTIDVDDIALLDRYVAIAGTASAGGAATPSSGLWLQALEVAERHLARLLESSLHALVDRTALAHEASEAAAEVGRLEEALAAERETSRAARGEAAQNKLDAEIARDELAELTEIVARTKGKASAQAERIAALEDSMTAAEADQKRLDQRWRIATDRAGRLERELAATRSTVPELADPQPRRRTAPTSGRSQAAPIPPPRVLHIMARSLPHASSPIATDRHRLLIAQRLAGLDSSAMTSLDFPWDLGIADPVGCDVVDGVAYYRLRDLDDASDADRLACAVRIGDQLLGVVEPQILHAASLDVAPLAIALARSHSLRSVVELTCELTGGEDFDPELLGGADHLVALSDEQKQRAVLAGVPEPSIAVIPAFDANHAEVAVHAYARLYAGDRAR